MTTHHPELYPDCNPNHLSRSRFQRTVDTIMGSLDRLFDFDGFFEAGNMPPTPHLAAYQPSEVAPQPQPEEVPPALAGYMSAAGIVGADFAIEEERIAADA